ncbi:MAG: flagellar M-ring protein FliF [Deltaproteobacteria bacterium]|nr:flagellar M-ring protein FliF [Deltaproteobacteria bacterium]
MKPLESLKKWWTEASSLARALLVGGGLTVMAALGFAISNPPNEDYALLYGHLAAADAGEILENLREKKVPFRLQDGGSTIFVPRSKVYELRAELARARLPRGGGGGDGNELFDKDTWMINDATQRVNTRRALEGELQRTLMKFPQIELARVHLALPESSLMRRERFQPSASVVLKLRSGEVVDRDTIAGVRHLVSGSVANLPAERVAILDGEGRLLDDGGNNPAGLGHDLESRLEKRITELLEPMIGPGHVVARVSAELELAKVDETSEQFDPESATVVSQSKQDDNASQKKNEPSMAAGTPSNIPQQAVSVGNTPLFQSNSGRSAVTTEYAISKVTRHTERPHGDLRRLSIAVLVDSSGATPAGGANAEGVDVPGSVEKRTPNALPSQTAIAELVKKAAGFSAERGDQIEVLFVPFSRQEIAETPVEPPSLAWAIPGWLPLTLVTGLGFLLVATSLFLTDKRKKAAELAAAKAAEALTPAHHGPGHHAPNGTNTGGPPQQPGEEEPEEEQAKAPRELVRGLGPDIAAPSVSVLKEWISSTPSKRGA